MFNFIIFGPPGSGKGTQAKRIAKKYGFAHLSTGEILRAEMRAGTELGMKVKSVVERGELVSDALLKEILKSGISGHQDAAGIIFDGYPRTMQQATDMDEIMEELKDDINIVLALEVSDEEIINRLLKRCISEGRTDDTREVIENRIVVYNKQTQPLINFYKEKGKFVSIDGTGGIQEIMDNICAEIDKIYEQTIH